LFELCNRQQPPRLTGKGCCLFFFGDRSLAKLLVIDNYDSFTYNLVQMFRHYDLVIDIHRSDKITTGRVEKINPDYILISPGPKDPEHAGISVPLIKQFSGKKPVFGVCLGMQCINEAFGGPTICAPLPMHGKTSSIEHNGQGIFKGIPSPFKAARYHSLMVSLPETQKEDSLAVTSRSSDGVIMGLSHLEYPVHGVQFHPESFLTENGFNIVENFLGLGVLGGLSSR